MSVRHNGGINGFEACNFMVPEDGIAIIWLDNTAQDNEVQEGVGAILYGRPAKPPALSIAHTIYPIIVRQGAESAVKRYHELKQQSPDRYDFSEAEVNLLGYHLLQHGRAEAAVQILSLNAESFPQSGNAYDSLGEALLATGDTVKAVANYKRSLELDPSNKNAAQLLQQLGAR
jgi:tetratricopeptide (TPR) repeat protein